jgi:hypothetical protein
MGAGPGGPGGRPAGTDGPAQPAARGTARRIVPLFRPCRGQVLIVALLILVTIGIINPLLT